jgi:hypothetical protein
MHGFFGKKYRKNLTPKITRLINTSYLSIFINNYFFAEITIFCLNG